MESIFEAIAIAAIDKYFPPFCPHCERDFNFDYPDEDDIRKWARGFVHEWTEKNKEELDGTGSSRHKDR